MAFRCEISKTSGPARRGKLTTSHGEVETPVFMPVGTAATVKGVPQDVLEALDVQILLANTYHLYLRPGIDQIRKLGGLHRFMSWPRAILTDSGGFQVFSLSDLRKVTEEGVTFRSHLDGSSHFLSPETAVEAQIGLGADIIMTFDECTEYPAEPSRIRDSMEMTLRWAERSKRHFEEHKREVPWNSPQPSAVSHQEKQIHVGPDSPAFRSSTVRVDPDAPARRSSTIPVDPDALACPERSRRVRAGEQHSPDAEHNSAGGAWSPAPTCSEERTQALFGIIQGGMDHVLRKESAERTIEIGFDGYAIGGLSVGEPRGLTREIVESTLEHLPKDQPRYLMGVGTPEEIVEYSNLGIDMMDCVLPTRAARHGLLFTSEGKISIKQARYAGDENPLDPKCPCQVCCRYSRAYLRHLYASNEVLAQVLNTIHNLSYYLDTMRRVRHSI
jgi:queuine/archaeosine tRNA-ribosyltransferase